ncbi:MAG: GNAT family N-acetyltransferase [Clostridiales bacterium]|nr:GNAT family N-acetyltransferase [Clostridiales bacterium]
MDYLLSEEYQTTVETLMDRAENPIRAVQLLDAHQSALGFALYCNYYTEDGKLFIMEFCVEPPCRGQGYGKLLYELIEAREKARGAKFAELTTDSATPFWQGLGFVNTGVADLDNGDFIFRKKIDL